MSLNTPSTSVEPSPRPPSAPHVDPVWAAFLCLMGNASRVGHEIASRLGLNDTDLRGLTFVAAHREVTPGQLAGHLGLTSSATTGVADHLETADLLVRRTHPTDRRSVILSLTPAGFRALSTMEALYRPALSAPSKRTPAELAELFTSMATALTPTRSQAT